MRCAPLSRNGQTSSAWPLESTVALPIFVSPSKNSTVPSPGFGSILAAILTSSPVSASSTTATIVSVWLVVKTSVVERALRPSPAATQYPAALTHRASPQPMLVSLNLILGLCAKHGSGLVEDREG